MAVIESLIDHKTNLTIHTVNGLVDGDDIIQRMEEYHSGEVTKLIIWDFSDADLRDLTTKKITSIANIGRHFTESRMGGQKALISLHNLSFGLGRMYEVLAEIEKFLIQTKVFRNMEEAKNWLGITDQSL